MTGFVFVIIFGLSSSLLSCEGQIISPPDGTKLTILPGSSENLTWNYVEDPPNFAERRWFFTSTDGSHSAELIVQITKFGLQVRKDVLPRIGITEPSTLSLNNVNQSYDGTYRFSLNIGAQPEVSSNVRVYIAIAPTVNLSCPSRSKVNKGNSVTFVCRGEGGNPPANVTLYKDGVPISETKQENNTLNLYDVNGTDSGNYTCVAQSYPTEAFKDEKSCELTVLSKPFGTTITFNPQPAIVGHLVEIMCDSKGFPVSHFNIIRNGEKIQTGKSHILQVNQSDEGPYTCIATNALGNDSATDNLTVTESTQTPTSSTIKPSPTQNIVSSTAKRKVSVPTPSREPKSEESVWFIVIMSLLGVVIIGIVVSYTLWRSCRKFRSSKHQSSPEPQTTEVDPTYQGLDLNKMNKEDNYQSLTGNYAASNDVAIEDESAYTELKKVRDVEDQYQSLQ